VPIRPEDSLHDLMVRSKEVGVEALLEAMAQIESGRVVRRAMDPAQATYFSFPKRADAQRLRRMGRALL
jgi:methionyl-tRNA formyltransferase